MVMRRTFTCSAPGCGRILATVAPRTVLRIAAGVALSHHRKFGSLALTCPCGEVKRFAVPRQVEVIEVEQEAA